MAFFNTSLNDLPELDAQASEHAELVKSTLLERISESDGWLPFDEYMHFVLYAPGLGYYSAGSTNFGQSGDFVTAPLISPLFSRTLAAFLSRQMQADDELLELGAGNGFMARDILDCLQSNEVAPTAYNILEPSADLQFQQSEVLAGIDARKVRWLDQLPGENSFTGIVLGNEVVDALPVKRFVLKNGAVFQQFVGSSEGELCFRLREAEEEFAMQVREVLSCELSYYSDGYSSELLVSLDAWLQALSLMMHSGLIVFIDYGYERKQYYDPARKTGTIRGFYRQFMVEDPLQFSGMMDLTASVDFTRLAEAAVNAGFDVCGYTTQANFLMENGLLELAAEPLENQKEQLSRAEAIKLLTDPGEMGEKIKVMVLAKNRELDRLFHRDFRYML